MNNLDLEQLASNSLDLDTSHLVYLTSVLLTCLIILPLIISNPSMMLLQNLDSCGSCQPTQHAYWVYVDVELGNIMDDLYCSRSWG